MKKNNQSIVRVLKNNNLTYQEIGDKLKISRQRAEQVYNGKHKYFIDDECNRIISALVVKKITEDGRYHTKRGVLEELIKQHRTF